MKCKFSAHEHAHQLAYFQANFGDRTGHRGYHFLLRPEHRLDGLLSDVRNTAEALFSPDALGIQWHTYIGHGRSSQACCLNFLMPLANKPELLRRWLVHTLGVHPQAMLPVEKALAAPHIYVAFEYTGPGDRDYLGEASGKVPQRGAHATASDAAVAYEDSEGKRHLVLIEWKYTEQYRNHKLSPDKSRQRHARYADKLLARAGPVRSDLGLTLDDFLFEPFYQLVRQQMLAWQIEADPHSGFDTVMVLHLSPRGNRALHHMTAPMIAQAIEAADGKQTSDAFEAYEACLEQPDRYAQRYIEDAFTTLAGEPDATWYPQLKARYPSLCPA